MPKIRKVQRRKRYQASVNRKRLRNKLTKLPNIGCPQIKKAWEDKKSTRANLEEMGLAYDPNVALKIPNTKRQLLEAVPKIVNQTIDDESESETEEMKIPPKQYVADELESEAKAPRENMFRLPNGQVQFITYMLDKYGDDYKAMVRDKKNYYQLTWRQIRAKINTFKKIPEQYNQYLETKNAEKNE